MIDKICEIITKRIRKQMPEIDNQRAEVIMYGLQLIIGEIPKILLLFVMAIILRIGWLVIFAYVTMLPYKIVAGGFHLKTHIGCTTGTLIVYFGNVLISKYLIIQPSFIKHISILLIWIFSIIMITLYAPADTINVPILRKEERKLKKILSYIFVTIELSIALILTMYSSLVLLKISDSKPLKSQIKTLMLSVGLLIACFFIHSSSAFAILLIPIFFLLRILDKLKVKYIVLIFNIIYFSRYFVNSDTLHSLILGYWDAFGSESYISYINEMEEMDFQNSFFEQFFNWIIITTSAVCFKKMSKACQLFSICYVASLFFQTLFGTNIQRVMIYLSIYVIFMIPNLVMFVNNSVKSGKRLIPYTLYGLMIGFCIMSYCKYLYWSPSGNYYKWKNYTSIFQAPTWK